MADGPILVTLDGLRNDGIAGEDALVGYDIENAGISPTSPPSGDAVLVGNDDPNVLVGAATVSGLGGNDNAHQQQPPRRRHDARRRRTAMTGSRLARGTPPAPGSPKRRRASPAGRRRRHLARGRCGAAPSCPSALDAGRARPWQAAVIDQRGRRHARRALELHRSWPGWWVEKLVLAPRAPSRALGGCRWSRGDRAFGQLIGGGGGGGAAAHGGRGQDAVCLAGDIGSRAEAREAEWCASRRSSARTRRRRKRVGPGVGCCAR